MNDDTLSFQLIFEDAFSISPYEIQDQLVIHFFQNATYYFYSPEIGKVLHETSRTLKKRIRK